MESLSEENYLKAIYNLTKRSEGKVSIKSIADILGNNPASVIDMLKKLTNKKLIAYDKQKGAKLTEKGFKSAIQIVRRHRLWEVFLKDKLGYAWDEVHDIAEQMEHIQQVDLADRLDKYLGYPQYDPHGDPIPTSKGLIPLASKITLSQIATNKSCQVVGVKDTSIAFLKYLQQLTIGIGTNIKILEKVAFDDSINIAIDRNIKASVSQKFSESLLVVNL